MLKNIIDINSDKLESLFPFHFILNSDIKIVSFGKGLKKLVPQISNDLFETHFSIKRPSRISSLKDEILDITEQVMIIESKANKELLLRGQFMYFENEKMILFAGAPWITDVDELNKLHLSINDFPIHNTVTDMIQIIKSKETVMDDIKELVETLRSQKQDLNKVTNRLSTLIKNLHKAVLVEDENRKIVLANDTFCELFNIPATPEQLIGADCSNSAEQVKHLFQDPENFVSRINHLLKERKLVSDEYLFMNNGVILQRDFIPIEIDGLYSGHLWQYRDVTEIRKNDIKLKQSEEKFRSVLENLDLGMLEVDLNNIVIRAYPGFCRLLGYTEEELLGKNALELLSSEQELSVMQAETSKRNQGKSGVYEIKIKKKNGELIWVVISGAPVYDVNRKITGSIGIHWDITQRKQKEKELEEAKEAAEQLLKTKQLFVSNVSHEIRTPLNVVIGMSELLMDSNLDNDLHDDIKIIKNSATHLLNIINDILDLSKIESGKSHWNENLINTKELIKNQILFHSINARNKQLKLHYNISNEVPEYIIGDELKLNQILTNLINNAIKFTDEGLINIEIRTKNETSEFVNLEFLISDTGIGIHPDKLDTIFESFTQAHIDTNRLYGGTGLGLTIVKELIEINNGSIWVESELNQGSTFHFILSFKKQGSRSINSNEIIETNTLENISGSSILVVEDNKLNLLVAKRMLENWGCKIDVAFNGQEAIDKIATHNYNMVIMDLQMPVLGGLEATKKIREELKSNVPIIAMTAYSNEEIYKECIDAGMNDVVKKPFKKSILRSTLQRMIGSNSLINTSLEPDLFNNPYLLDVTNGDSVILKSIIDAFLEEAQPSIEQIKKSLTTNNKIDLERAIHKIKPSLKIFDQKQLSEMVTKFEQIKDTNDWNKIEPLIEIFLHSLKQFMIKLENTHVTDPTK
jgi:PAS domain S-box-containing protein